MENKSSFQACYYKLFWKWKTYFHLEIQTSMFHEIWNKENIIEPQIGV